jgi:hypothetical protein
MTPLLVLDFTLTAFATAIYFKDGSWFLFIIVGICVMYTLVRYEKFSKKEPWMLSSEHIQKYGMQLTLGDNTNTLDSTNVIDVEPIDNPENSPTLTDGGNQ